MTLMPWTMMKRFRGGPRVASRPEFPGLHRIPWDFVVDYLLEERTDLDETTSAGLESLGRLATCNSALRECLRYRICASLQTVRQMTDRFIRDRVTRLDVHPNIILRGRLWHAFQRDNADPENMHVRLAENLQAQQWRVQQMARRVTRKAGYRNGRDFAAMVVRTFLSQDLADINMALQALERS
ncbi:hypothetical protein AK812_SmicGene21449 [Symbiodinium microadriaticum]|uniref:Uncharacterized protein n=1 Tax=Symbiodinium microadriaticum TaxID=2951 RepID=A0A1Q9DMG0_SYMMI|nr:hypothetical protein AK812_SmicGene21449 [Symbiodinium microadriaticum]